METTGREGEEMEGEEEPRRKGKGEEIGQIRKGKWNQKGKERGDKMEGKPREIERRN